MSAGKATTILIATVALAAGAAAYHWLPPIKTEPMALPEFTFQDDQGIQRNSREWQGKVLVINFWASWCPPCREEIPEFIELQKAYGRQGVQFVGIAIEDQQSAAEFAKRVGINYPILIGEIGGTELSLQLGNSLQALPFSVVVDNSGKVIHRHPGSFNKQQIIEIISPLIG